MRSENRLSADYKITVRPLIVPEIVAFPVEVDISNAARCGSELLAALRPGVSVVIADMSHTKFCDASAVPYLLIGRDAARQHGAELRVVVAARAILRMMEVVGLDRVLQIYGNMADALFGTSAQARTELSALR